MRIDQRRFGVERRCDGNTETLRELHELSLSPRRDHAAAGDDHRFLRRGYRRKRVANALHFRLRPERRCAPINCFDERIELAFLLGHLTEMALNAKMDRTRRTRSR